MNCDSKCDFCEEFKQLPEVTGRTITYLANDFVVLASLGCFRDGYSLLMPVEHRRSFASLGHERLALAEPAIEYVRRIIGSEYSTPVIVAEHGPGIVDKGASCCDHAHIHIIPVDDPEKVLLQFRNSGHEHHSLPRLSALTEWQAAPYIYLSCTPGQHLVWENMGLFGKQFVRHVCANLDGLGMIANWRIYPFRRKMLQTAERLRHRFEEKQALARHQ